MLDGVDAFTERVSLSGKFVRDCLNVCTVQVIFLAEGVGVPGDSGGVFDLVLLRLCWN